MCKSARAQCVWQLSRAALTGCSHKWSALLVASRAPSCKHTKRRREHQASSSIYALPSHTTLPLFDSQEHNCFGQLHNGAHAIKSTKQFCPTTQQSRTQLPWSTAYLHNCAPATKRVCCITAVKKSWPNILRASANQARSTAHFFWSICKISLSYN